MERMWNNIHKWFNQILFDIRITLAVVWNDIQLWYEEKCAYFLDIQDKQGDKWDRFNK